MNLKEYIIEKLHIDKDTDIIKDKIIDKIKDIITKRLEDFRYYEDEGDYEIKEISEHLDVVDIVFKINLSKYDLRHITEKLARELQNKIKEYTFDGVYDFKEDTIRINITK